MKTNIKKWLWSVWAVIVGYIAMLVIAVLVFIITSGISDTVDPIYRTFRWESGRFILNFVYGLIGGYATAITAKYQKLGHAMVLSALLLLGIVFGYSEYNAMEATYPIWYMAGETILASLGVYAGALLYLKKNKKNETSKKKNNKKLILGHLVEKKRITNNEVEDILGLSDASATIYLDELEKSGDIEQVGDTGRGVWYKLKE
jgi:hypothetical protein